MLSRFGAFLLFVVNNHVEGARIGPWRSAMDLEAIGFVLQLACFGYIAVARVVDQGRRLVAIDQEMRSARDIQAAILPRHVSSVGGVHVTARYEPLAAVSATVPFAPGGRLVMYTDGITETPCDDDDLFGIDGLVEFTDTHRGDAAAVFADALLGELRRDVHTARVSHMTI